MAKFKTRARALDLLGRQQIAGIPTAINELIKNAHDAYADRFDIDFLRGRNLLILRDDGMGMTKEDFETRWLTLGTESKLSKNASNLPPIDTSKKRRAITGEKGIGRLAIASIGCQVLIITKAKFRESSHKIVASLINWELFELPGINLEDIVIPVYEFDSYLTRSDVEKLKDEILVSLENLRVNNLISLSNFQNIRNSIKNFRIDPSRLSEKLAPGFDLQGEHGGTHFFISPVYETINSDISGDLASDGATKMEKMLMGFHNTMTPGHQEPLIDISFRDYRSSDGSYVSLIDKEHFFTTEDFEVADHHIQGEFDEYGQFKGDICIYGDKTFNHSVLWNENHYRETDCGPFKINFAYLQGELKSSRVPPESYVRIKAKGDKFGGLYIYRNNIRVLPYGDSDYDFLDIEKNRSKRASTYFFSYRRMFGAIEIADGHRSKLIEKAGREGFIENKAYRQLRAILKNFFVQLAADFFAEKSDSVPAEFFNRRKEELNSYHRVLEEREKQSRWKKDRFSNELDKFFEQLSKKQFEEDISVILEELEKELNFLKYQFDPEEIAQKIIELEQKARQDLFDYRRQITVPSPRGFAINKSMRQLYGRYLDEFSLLEISLFEPSLKKIDDLIKKCSTSLDIEINTKKRMEEAITRISKDALALNQKKKFETKEAVALVSKKVNYLISELIQELENQVQSVKYEFRRASLNRDGKFDLFEERKKLENSIEAISVRNTEAMERIISQFESFYIEKKLDGNIITNDQIVDAASEELEELRNQLQTDVELSQLGLAVGILHHEFGSSVNSIRLGLRDLKAWSDIDSRVEAVYKNLKINFEHLEGYLSLFTPLNRRLNRRKESIPLTDIKKFLMDLFGERLSRHNIAFKHTKEFARRQIFGFRSTFYPVFVNIIDNAIYWLSHCDVEERLIRLHADDTGIYISNNGPSIKSQDKEQIFEMRFSRKENGRGLGLTISRETLKEEGYTLVVDEPRRDCTVTFKIQKEEKEE